MMSTDTISLCSGLRFQWEGLTTLSRRSLSRYQGQQVLSYHHMARKGSNSVKILLSMR